MLYNKQVVGVRYQCGMTAALLRRCDMEPVCSCGAVLENDETGGMYCPACGRCYGVTERITYRPIRYRPDYETRETPE
jgi:uncharacterized protein YbaR (Trm112 family)